MFYLSSLALLYFALERYLGKSFIRFVNISLVFFLSYTP